MTGDHLSFDGNCGVRPAELRPVRAIQRCTALPFLCFSFVFLVFLRAESAGAAGSTQLHDPTRGWNLSYRRCHQHDLWLTHCGPGLPGLQLVLPCRAVLWCGPRSFAQRLGRIRQRLLYSLFSTRKTLADRSQHV